MKSLLVSLSLLSFLSLVSASYRLGWGPFPEDIKTASLWNVKIDMATDVEYKTGYRSGPKIKKISANYTIPPKSHTEIVELKVGAYFFLNLKFEVFSIWEFSMQMFISVLDLIPYG